MNSENIAFNEKYVNLLLERIDQLIAATQKLQRPLFDPKITLWNTTEVAKYLGRSYRYTSEYIVTHHTFPHAMRITVSDGKKGHPRWHANDVIEWVTGFKEG